MVGFFIVSFAAYMAGLDFDHGAALLGLVGAVGAGWFVSTRVAKTVGTRTSLHATSGTTSEPTASLVVGSPTKRRSWILVAIFVAILAVIQWQTVDAASGLVKNVIAKNKSDFRVPYEVSRVDVPLYAFLSNAYLVNVTLQNPAVDSDFKVIPAAVAGFCAFECSVELRNIDLLALKQ